MPRHIVKFKNYYLEWSTITDSPITYGMRLDDFKDYYLGKYGWAGYENLSARLERVEEFGHSAHHRVPVQVLLKHNRAGPNEEELSYNEIYTAYCKRKPIHDGWIPE